MLLIKDIPKIERPRERLLNYGQEHLSNTELLAIILRTGSRGEGVNTLATRVLNSLKNLNEIVDINYEQLIKIKGIGEVKAIELLAAIELGKRIYLKKENKKMETFNNALDIYEANKYLFEGKKQEYFYCIYLNNQNVVIERKLLFMGTLNSSTAHPRDIFREAYLVSASSIICMHNHPSGDVIPSQDDIILTKSLIEIGRLQQIPIIDHIIFGKDKYYSFYDNQNFRW